MRCCCQPRQQALCLHAGGLLFSLQRQKVEAVWKSPARCIPPSNLMQQSCHLKRTMTAMTSRKWEMVHAARCLGVLQLLSFLPHLHQLLLLQLLLPILIVVHHPVLVQKLCLNPHRVLALPSPFSGHETSCRLSDPSAPCGGSCPRCLSYLSARYCGWFCWL
ncbi:hypothetical protein TcCL_NonESM06357 [Trypanosoma cruzi]|nr:hypothetical protein TcCL_NonESM06357 [Trypanosoma cruzi]